MALRISAAEARCQLMEYADLVNEVKKQADKNFKDMDFENANRREAMEDIIQKMIKDCEDTVDTMESLYLE